MVFFAHTHTTHTHTHTHTHTCTEGVHIHGCRSALSVSLAVGGGAVTAEGAVSQGTRQALAPALKRKHHAAQGRSDVGAAT